MQRVGVWACLAAGILTMGGCPLMHGVPPASDGPRPYVNIQLDAEGQDTAGLHAVANALRERGLKATVYVSGDYANRNALAIWQLYADGFEIALHGYYTGEQLATMTYEEQRDLLTRAKQAIEGCQPCGTYKPVVGFRPQYFSQNEDTYRVLDELGLAYNSGFKARELYAEGHADDAAPYPIEGHRFMAVPISTVRRGDRHVYLCDIACANVEGWTGRQFADALREGLDAAAAAGEPLVILVHGYHTGDASKDYWTPFVEFLDEVAGRAETLTTAELVERYATSGTGGG